jgi:hypothetical protein
MSETSLETAYLMVWLDQVLNRPDHGRFSIKVRLAIQVLSTQNYAGYGRSSVDVLLFNQLTNLELRSSSGDEVAEQEANREVDQKFIRAILDLFSQRVDWDTVGRLIASKTGWQPTDSDDEASSD